MKKLVLALMVLVGATQMAMAQGALGEGPRPNVPPVQFFSTMQDVPLVPGLKELKDQSVAFDKPDGRIVEAVAEIETFAPEAIQRTYEETLPQLGWMKTGEKKFERERETLTLNFERYERRNFVRILVKPTDAVLN